MTPRLPPGNRGQPAPRARARAKRPAAHALSYRFIAGHLDSAGVVNACSPGTVATTVR